MSNPANFRTAHSNMFAMTLAAMLAVIAFGFVDRTLGQRPRSRTMLNRLAQQGGDDAASVLFRGGRDLITDQQWAKAEETFNQYVSRYPKEKNIDAALYWIAYSQYQLTRFDQCKGTIERLLKTYQDSSWREDARALLAQMPGAVALQAVRDPASGAVVAYAPVASTISPDTYVSAGSGVGVGTGVGSPGTPTPPKAVYGPRGRGPYPMPRPSVALFPGDDDNQAADDDPCEFKIVVLQALFQSDAQRGITVATEWLAPGSTQTVRCKGAALTLLGRHGGKAVTPVILGVAQRETDLKLRARAISALGATNDDTVIDPLRDFALNSKENEVVEASLYALSQHTGARAVPVLSEIALSNRSTGLRRLAISSIANRPGEASVDALLKIYDGDQTLEIRKSVIAGFGHRRSERAGNKLLEIARSADNIELRKAAISALASRGGEKSIDTLLSLYDTEKSEELKDRIINSVGSFNDPRVTRKLIEIAKNPQSPMERRRRAIGWLSHSKDPEVTKFLEDLLK